MGKKETEKAKRSQNGVPKRVQKPKRTSSVTSDNNFDKNLNTLLHNKLRSHLKTRGQSGLRLRSCYQQKKSTAFPQQSNSKGERGSDVSAGNRLLREALSRMLTKNGDIEVIDGESSEPALTENLRAEAGEIFLLSSKGDLDRDLEAIRKIRASMSGRDAGAQ